MRGEAANLPSPWPIPGRTTCRLLSMRGSAQFYCWMCFVGSAATTASNTIARTARCATWCRAGARWPHRLPRQVNYWLVSHHPAAGHLVDPTGPFSSRPKPATARHRRHDSRQRDRRRARRRTSLLFLCGFLPDPGARSDDDDCARRKARFVEEVRQASTRTPRQSCLVGNFQAAGR